MNLPATGTVDRTTWEAMGLGARTDLAVLQIGSKHPSVSTLQRALARVLRKKILVTGQFTSSLANDVKTYQKRAKIRASGKVGRSTWSSLMAAAALAK
jgi:peptidoglycan hydrolase-like protein with peptidoglycan-binding domain